MAAIPESFHDLMTNPKAFAHLATVSANGAPQVTPVWFDYSGGHIRVNSAKGRVKSNNMTVGAKVALSILDPDNSYRYIQIRGTVARVTEEGGVAHIDALAKKYMGRDTYPYHNPKDVRMIFEIEPTRAQTMG